MLTRAVAQRVPVIGCRTIVGERVDLIFDSIAWCVVEAPRCQILAGWDVTLFYRWETVGCRGVATLLQSFNNFATNVYARHRGPAIYRAISNQKNIINPVAQIKLFSSRDMPKFKKCKIVKWYLHEKKIFLLPNYISMNFKLPDHQIRKAWNRNVD